MPTQEQLVAISTPLGDDKLSLRKAKIQEALGEPFTIDVEMVSDDENISLDDILGQNVTIRLETEDDSRFFNGIVTEFFQKENIAKNACYGAIIRPWFWLLTLSENCRIFQEKSYPEIIKKVFEDLGFSDFEDKLSSTYAKQDYVVQFNESDFNFVSRIMEQEGIYYFFTHTNGKHSLVMADDSSAMTNIGQVPFIELEDESRHKDVEGIKYWENYRKVRTGGVGLTNFDFTLPSKNLDAITKDPKTASLSSLQKFNFPGKYLERTKGSDYTKILMQKENVSYDQKSAQGNYRKLYAGAQFELTDHHRDDQNTTYLITHFSCVLLADDYIATSTNKDDQLFESQFTLVPDNVIYRPQITAIKPKMTGPQTATVVGKSGEEIWTDKYGRIKVLFHWDREAKADENSSCWIRVSQTWAGKGWGTMYIPRIGQEVLVDFIHGDPDNPIVIGSVYNGSTMPPYALPANATMSGIKTRSTKGGGGFNEIRLEDKKGEEQIFVHGEKNQDINIKNDCFETIGHDRHLIVKNDQIELIENNRSEEVKADHVEKIGKDRHLDVVGKEAKKVKASLSLTVTGDVAEVFKANHSMQVTDDSYIKGTNICIEATENITLKVGKSTIAISSAGIAIETKGDIKLDAGGNLDAKAGANIGIDAGANLDAKSGANTKVKAGAMGNFEAGGIATIKGSMVKVN
jgi:type VI secretion system secreted protein VgrG